ncbi:MAG TPA: FkbM family methyltransferase [Trichocoleus sp.]|jgi:FkbM family methyltransferase
MKTNSATAPADLYRHYLRQHCPDLEQETIAPFLTTLETANWDEPESALDLNNFAVMALIEAEQCNDPELRAMNLDIAMEALAQGADFDPLCAAHLALIHSMTGNSQAATELAFATFLETLHPAHYSVEPSPLGLVYVPPEPLKQVQTELLENLLQAENGYNQALLLLADVLCRSQLVFYNAYGQRFLQLVTQVSPDSVHRNLQLGLASLMQQRWEGLFHLQRAREIAPDYAPAVQALYLAYRELQQTEIAESWQQFGQTQAQSDRAYAWATLEHNSPFTYVPFNNLQLAVEPSFQSIVTIVLLANGDWFEAEMEFWREQLKPGMTVIDVGANVGVYTFSAAQAVGELGRVIAIEPFSYCVQCLEETKRINQLNQVTICAGAASDRVSKARLSLHSASELNEVITEETPQSGDFEEIDCFSLDSLIDQENLQRVDWLKIDAEGHEMKVLAGSDRLLRQFQPGILYENVAASSGDNTPVAEYLMSIGYRLFRYQPYLQTLIPIHAIEELQGSLNIVALPAKNA